MDIKRKLGGIIYYLIAKNLPPSYSGIKLGQTALRRLCGKLMLKECGVGVNIEKNAFFQKKLHWVIIQDSVLIQKYMENVLSADR